MCRATSRVKIQSGMAEAADGRRPFISSSSPRSKLGVTSTDPVSVARHLESSVGICIKNSVVVFRNYFQSNLYKIDFPSIETEINNEPISNRIMYQRWLYKVKFILCNVLPILSMYSWSDIAVAISLIYTTVLSEKEICLTRRACENWLYTMSRCIIWIVCSELQVADFWWLFSYWQDFKTIHYDHHVVLNYGLVWNTHPRASGERSSSSFG